MTASLPEEIEPQGIRRQALFNYEGFVLYLEELVCKRIGKEDIWNSRYKTLNDEYKSMSNVFNKVEESIGRFGFLSSMGFLKHYDDATIVDFIRKAVLNQVISYNLSRAQKCKEDMNGAHPTHYRIPKVAELSEIYAANAVEMSKGRN